MNENSDLPVKMPSQIGLAVLFLWLSWLLYWLTSFGYTHQMLSNPESSPELMAMLNETIAQLQEQNGGEVALDTEQLLQSVQKFVIIAFAALAMLSAGIVAWVLRQVKRGQDWARVLCLIIGVLNIFAIFKLPGGIYSAGTIGYLALGYGALFLLFTKPGAGWFRPGAAQAAKPNKNGDW